MIHGVGFPRQLRKTNFARNQRGVLVLAPAGNIITFDKGSDGVLTPTNTFVPGETSAKVHFGNGGILTQGSGIGKIDTDSGSPLAFAWFQGQNDVNAATWKVEGECDVTAVVGTNMEIVLLGITGLARTASFDWTGGATLINVGITVAKQGPPGLNIRFTYNNAGARAIPGLFTDKWPLATVTPIKYSIESDGVDVIFKFDLDAVLGPTEVCSVSLAAITFGSGLFPFAGQPIDFVTWRMVEAFDNFKGWG